MKKKPFIIQHSAFIAALFLCASAVRAQTPIQTDRLVANEVQIVTPALVPVSSVNAQVVGNGGSATYYYWIVANFAAGNATPSDPALVISAPSTLSATNLIRVSWLPVAGATSYDVLRTTAPQLPNGQATIAVTTALAAATFNDTGGALSAYTVTTLVPRQIAAQFVLPYWDALGWVAPPVSSSNHGRIYYDLAANQWMSSANGGAYSAFGSGAGSGIKSLNGLSSQDQFLTVSCTSGLDVNIEPNIDTNAFCFPDASATARGLVTTGAQLFGGNKTFIGDTLMNGDLYVTDFFSTDNPIEITGEPCATAEANVGLWGFDPTTGLPCWSYDGSAPVTLPPPDGGATPASTGTGLLTGGGVVWTGNLNFSVSPATYLIGGTSYTSPLTAITLDAADPADPRIDVIAVDNTGSAIKITGTAATPPAAPSVDPTTQVSLTFVYIAALSTTPGNFSTTNIYLENTEWTCTASANFNCASVVNPYAGTKDIEATTAVSGNNVTLVKPAAGTENLSAYSNLVFYVRSKASWPTPKSVIFSWLNGATPVGSAVTLDEGMYGFSSSQITSYQQIVIPAANFGTGGNLVTTLKIQVSGGGGSIGFYLDNIFLQAQTGSAQPVVNPYDVVSFFSGVPGATETLNRVVFARSVSFPIALSGSRASAGVAATASTVVTLNKNGASFGTCTFGVGATTCTFASTVGSLFAAGDVLTVVGPGVADATLADIAITLAGTR